MAKRKKGEHYVDNKVFLQAMIEWRDKCANGRYNNQPPPVTNYIRRFFKDCTSPIDLIY